MYKIEIKNKDGIFIAELLYKLPFEEEFQVKDAFWHVDFNIVMDSLNAWSVIQRKNELKYS